MCTYIIPNVSSSVQNREIHKLTQAYGAFHLVSRCYNFNSEAKFDHVIICV